MARSLDVFLGERRVGELTNLDGDQNVFTFDASYADDPNRPTLSSAFFDAERNLSLPSKTPRVRLLPFFANLLPEGHLREYLAAQANVNPARDFPLLRLLGEDLPGAVVVRPASSATLAPDDADSVVAASVEENRSILKFSLAGVQLKFSAVKESDGGLTIPVHGRGGHWMLKMPSAVYANVPENEFAMMSFASAVDITVPEMALIDPASVRNMPAGVRNDLGRALSIRRFDRIGSERIHIEDFNQIYNQYPSDKYKNVSYGNMLGDIWRLMGESQTREFVRRLIFNIGIGNADMHLKNWSVIYADGKTPALAPAYDFVSTIAYIEDDALALTVAATRRWSDISYDRLERFARKAGVPRGVVLDSTEDMVARMRDTWPRLKSSFDLPDRLIKKIDAHLESIPIFGGGTSFAGVAPLTQAHEEIS